MYFEEYFSTMLWYIESFTKFETDLFFFFNLYLLYLNHACLSNILFCMGSNKDYFDFDLP